MTAALVELAGPGHEGVAVLSLARPEKRNALSIATRDQMSDAVDQLAADGACRVVIITGAGGASSAGFQRPLAPDDPGVPVADRRGRERRGVRRRLRARWRARSPRLHAMGCC